MAKARVLKSCFWVCFYNYVDILLWWKYESNMKMISPAFIWFSNQQVQVKYKAKLSWKCYNNNLSKCAQPFKTGHVTMHRINQSHSNSCSEVTSCFFRIFLTSSWFYPAAEVYSMSSISLCKGFRRGYKKNFQNFRPSNVGHHCQDVLFKVLDKYLWQDIPPNMKKESRRMYQGGCQETNSNIYRFAGATGHLTACDHNLFISLGYGVKSVSESWFSRKRTIQVCLNFSK